MCFGSIYCYGWYDDMDLTRVNFKKIFGFEIFEEIIFRRTKILKIQLKFKY